MPNLALGPLLRFVDERVATVWVQTDGACEVEILGRRERTWCVNGLHFALVAIDDLTPGADHPYEVRLNGERAWPPADSPFPASTIRLLDPDAPRRISFGSCRIARPHEPPFVLRRHEHPEGHGVDALRALALCAAKPDPAHPEATRPDLLLMLGDQIYADQPSPALEAALAERERPADAPEDELVDFVDYAMAYREAWSDPAIRWLLSTVPSAMVFDDHEIHAEWRTSQGWLDEMNAEPWFDRHIRAGLAAYWVFQHLGNLSPAELTAGGLYDEVRAQNDAAELLASRMDTEGRQTGHSRWSFARELGDARLVVIDSRAGRDVTPGRREIVGDEEWTWIAEQARKPARHLLLASSVPILLAPGLHHVQAADEALADGDKGRLGAALGERLRRMAVMDQWASFQRSFRRMAELLDDVAHGRAGERPAAIVLLSGDVHHCYLAEVGFRSADSPRSPVWQVVCSALRKELDPHERAVIGLGHSTAAGRLARRLARAVGVREAPLGWRVVERPAYGNQIGTLTLDGDRAAVAVEAVVDGSWREPRLQTAFARTLTSEALPSLVGLHRNSEREPWQYDSV
ncbi:MAG TPA: alkaline phosphatase D family protein [Conexibacter sp.]|nr:alkaline phosphatase D family protein [Conexibacter sp.]